MNVTVISIDGLYDKYGTYHLDDGSELLGKMGYFRDLIEVAFEGEFNPPVEVRIDDYGHALAIKKNNVWIRLV